MDINTQPLSPIDKRSIQGINDKLGRFNVNQHREKEVLNTYGHHSGLIQLSFSNKVAPDTLWRLETSLQSLETLDRANLRGNGIDCGTLPQQDAFEAAKEVLGVLQQYNIINEPELQRAYSELQLSSDHITHNTPQPTNKGR